MSLFGQIRFLRSAVGISSIPRFLSPAPSHVHPSICMTYAAAAADGSHSPAPDGPSDSPKSTLVRACAQPSSSSHHFHARASYLGSDIDVLGLSHSPLLSDRCLKSSRDFAVFTLKPTLSPTKGISLLSAAEQSAGIQPPEARTSSGDTTGVQPPGSGALFGSDAEEMLLEEAKVYGVLVAFKFGSVVSMIPTPEPNPDPSHTSYTTTATPAAAAASDRRMAAELLQATLASAIRPRREVSLSDCIGSENANLVVRPNMKRDFAKERDLVVVPDLDIGNLEVICRVLGQSAALDFYTRTTEQQVEALDAVLAELATNAGKPFYRRPFLFRRLRGGRLLSRIASSSIVYNKVASKLGLLDTSRTAWDSDRHDIVWRGLRREYELTERFENLLKRLDIFKEESRFILDVRNERAGTVAEMTIIALITVEIIIQIYTHFVDKA